MENIDNKIEQAKEAVKELRQAKALADAPINEVKENRSRMYAEVQNAMKEKRAVTLGGTGNVLVAKELVKAATAKKDILSKFRYFYGPNAQTGIPVWNGGLGRAHEVAENGTWTETDTATLAAKTLLPKAFAKTIVVSNEVLKLGATNFEAELNGIIEDLYGETIAYEIFNADGTGAFTKIDSGATEIEVTDKTALTGLAKFALSVADKMDGAVILMSPASYSAMTASDSNAKEKAYAKSLIENKTIEGVPVILSSLCGNTVIAGDMTNYAIAIADEITIEPKKSVGSLATSFDVSCYMAGTPCANDRLYVMKNA